MKTLFIKTGKSIRLVDKDRMIFDLYDGSYCNIEGQPVPAEDSFKPKSHSDDDYDIWNSWWIEYEGLEEKLISESTTEPEEEIDDTFGNYGFKNRKGEFVIEPQYAYAHEFTCGLAAVNLNRTWYRSPEGRRFYENHFGYINARGETVIPFAYDEAWPFNKYGVAVVEDRKGSYLIDLDGKIVPGTERFNFGHYYDYEDRFIEITHHSEEYQDEAPIGLFDTKERKVLLVPSVDDVIQWDEDHLLIYERGFEFGDGDFRQYYLDSHGEILYPWLKDKGFSIVERPNSKQVAIVAIARWDELTGNPSSYFKNNGKKYKRDFLYGIYSSKEKFIIPCEYDKIIELVENIFACIKNDTITVIQIEDSEC